MMPSFNEKNSSGDAEQYLSAGVVSTSTSDYKYQGQLEATVDVYTMKDAAGARKILETGKTSDASSVQLGDAGIRYAQSILFRKGSSLVRIVAFESAPDAGNWSWIFFLQPATTTTATITRTVTAHFQFEQNFIATISLISC